MATFKMDPNFERNLRRAVQPAMNQMAKDYQKALDGVSRTHAGRPVAEIKPVLRRAWQQVGGDITDPELTQYAQQISDGGKIVFDA